MAIALLSRRGRYYSQPDGTTQLAKVYQDRAEFFSLMNGEVFARDISKGNTLIPQAGAPTSVIVPWGRSLHFDRLASHLATARNIAVLSNFTVMAWVRPTGVLNSAYSRIVETNYASYFYLGSNSGTQYDWVVNNSGLEDCIGGQQVLGQRDFVCGTFDGTNRVLYVNGVAVASSTAIAPTTAAVLNIGRFPGSYTWEGEIDTVGIFNDAFGPDEIWGIYQDPNRILETPKRYLGFSAVSGGATTYLQSVSGSLTPAGGLSRLISKYPSGSITSTGSIVKLTSRSLAGSSTASGSLNKLTTHSFAGSITPSGTLATMILFTCAVVGSLAASGALQKMTLKALAGASTISGAVSKLTLKGIGGFLSISGGLLKKTFKVYAGSVTVTGTLTEAYSVLKSLAGSIKPTGVVTAVYIAFVAGVLKLLALMGVGQ